MFTQLTPGHLVGGHVPQHRGDELLRHLLSLRHVPQQQRGLHHPPAVGDQAAEQQQRGQHARPLRRMGHGDLVHPLRGIAGTQI